jgi:rhodanese-related sulfurtransferase
MTHRWPRIDPTRVREALRARREIALVDVREEDPYAQSHPLFAVQLSSSRLELDAPWRLPRRDVPVVLYDGGDGLTESAARTLQTLGWTQVHLLEGGLAGWQQSGGELFRDVNVPSKAFGELVEHVRGTPSLPAEDVQALLDSGADMVVLDARRWDEYRTMSIPGGTSVPGAELVLRARDLAPDPATRIIVNCAGRTRSLIGAQSLINAGLPNPVAALRNGTIGWVLAGQTLERGQSRRFGPVSAASLTAARESAQRLAARAGAQRIDGDGLAQWEADTRRTLYRWDVRTPEEYAAGHRPGFGSAPGGQLVQETDVYAAVRGARIVLADGGSASDGVRAPMTAHWLAQMGWEVAWLDAPPSPPGSKLQADEWRPTALEPPAVDSISVDELASLLAHDAVTLIDFATSAEHVKGHVPGAFWTMRSALRAKQATPLSALPQPPQRLVTTGTGLLPQFAAADLHTLTDVPVAVLEGGNAAWQARGLPMQSGEQRLLSPRIDRYRRPYEGTEAPRAAMQAYLDWEFGLVAQLARDATHGFHVLAAG